TWVSGAAGTRARRRTWVAAAPRGAASAGAGAAGPDPEGRADRGDVGGRWFAAVAVLATADDEPAGGRGAAEPMGALRGGRGARAEGSDGTAAPGNAEGAAALDGGSLVLGSEPAGGERRDVSVGGPAELDPGGPAAPGGLPAGAFTARGISGAGTGSPLAARAPRRMTRVATPGSRRWTVSRLPSWATRKGTSRAKVKSSRARRLSSRCRTETTTWSSGPSFTSRVTAGNASV